MSEEEAESVQKHPLWGPSTIHPALIFRSVDVFKYIDASTERKMIRALDPHCTVVVCGTKLSLNER